MNREVFSTHLVECRGRRFDYRGEWSEEPDTTLPTKKALKKPVRGLITIFRDGVREVCCAHLNTDTDEPENCQASYEDLRPVCPYISKRCASKSS